MDFFEAIEKRHSSRSYKTEAVEKEKLQKLLDAARLAPTACNLQAFKLYIIETKSNKEGLKKLYGRDWFTEAPYVIGICAVKDKSWVRRDGKCYSDVDCAIVMDHLILSATALGLGTCWIGAFDVNAARELLELDESLEPVAFTPLGYEKDNQFTKSRKEIEDLVIFK